MSGTCGTCKHWRPPTERNDFRNLFRNDDADRKFGMCNLIDLSYNWEDDLDPLPLAVTQDGSDYRADLFTQAEFGCAMHEEK